MVIQPNTYYRCIRKTERKAYVFGGKERILLKAIRMNGIGSVLYSLHASSCHVVYLYNVLTITVILHLLSRYVVQYCEAHPEAGAAVETELELSKEMVGLLPLKINRLKARMTANNPATPLLTD